jgi:hypothetical protein
MEKLVRSDHMVQSDIHLPGGWKISVGGYPIPPLSMGRNLALLIHERRDALSEEDRNDPSFGANSDLWRLMLAVVADVCQACVNAFEGSVRPHSSTRWATTIGGMAATMRLVTMLVS